MSAPLDEADIVVKASSSVEHDRGGQHVTRTAVGVQVYSRTLGVGVVVDQARSQLACKAEALRLLRLIAADLLGGS